MLFRTSFCALRQNGCVGGRTGVWLFRDFLLAVLQEEKFESIICISFAPTAFNTLLTPATAGPIQVRTTQPSDDQKTHALKEIRRQTYRGRSYLRLGMQSFLTTNSVWVLFVLIENINIYPDAIAIIRGVGVDVVVAVGR